MADPNNNNNPSMSGMGSVLAGLTAGAYAYGGQRMPEHLQYGFLNKQDQQSAQRVRTAQDMAQYMPGDLSDSKQWTVFSAMYPDQANTLFQMKKYQATKDAAALPQTEQVSAAGQTFNITKDMSGNIQSVTDMNGNDATQHFQQMQQQQYDQAHAPTGRNFSPLNVGGHGYVINNSTGHVEPINAQSQQAPAPGQSNQPSSQFKYNTLEDLDPKTTIGKRYDKVQNQLDKNDDAFRELQTNSEGLVNLLNPGASQYDLQAAIYQFNKMLDPGSVVRESEFATAINNAGIKDKLSNYAGKIEKGMSLTDDQMSDLRKTIVKLSKTTSNAYTRQRDNRIKNNSTHYGINPDVYSPGAQVLNFDNAPGSNTTSNNNGANDVQMIGGYKVRVKG